MPEPRGSRASAGHTDCLSSVISQRRGRGWRRCMGLPIAAAMNDASSKLAEVRAAIAKAAVLAGRKPEEVILIAVSKTHPAEAIAPLIAAGQRDFGENRVQEAQAKWPALKAGAPDLRLHLIGNLQ